MWVRTRLGVSIVDDLIEGGVPSTSTVLVLGDPGSGKSILCQQILASGLKAGGCGIYAAFDDTPEDARAVMEAFGHDVRGYEEEGRLIFIGGSSTNPPDFNTVNLRLSEALEKLRRGEPTRIIIDSLTSLLSSQQGRPGLGLEFLRTLSAKVRAYGALCFYTLNRQGFDEKTVALIKDLSDGVVEMKLEERNGSLRSYVRVSKMKGSNHSKKWLPYSIDPEVGITFYKPTILLTGPEGAGKSTVAGLFKGETWTVGDLTVEALVCERADRGFWTMLRSRDISGVVLMVDCSMPESFPQALDMLHAVETPGLPYVVLANKQDLPGAITPENVREEMRLPGEVPVVGSVALKGQGIEEALRALVKQIIRLPV
ncbi:MAG: ATPase domain-containing protein [Candidatus Bathyarchaeia archaeon]